MSLNIDTPTHGTARRWIGGLLLAHWCVVVAIKVSQGRGVELLWLSHIALLLTAVSFLFSSWRLPRVVLAALVVPHTLWLVDAAGLLLTGESPMGITVYLSTATPADWIATLHHFYLLPLLIATVYRRSGWETSELAMAWGLLVALALAGHVFSSPATNVNYGFALLAGIDHPLLNALNAAHPTVYLMVFALIGLVCIALPGALLCRYLCHGRLWPARRSAPEASVSHG